MLEIGSVVAYVPDTIHAFVPFTDENGVTKFTWAIGKKSSPNGPVVEMSFDDLVRLKRNKSSKLGSVVYMQPNNVWNAVVTEVHEDGSVNLDIKSGDAVTLHCPNVKEDPTGKTPHTFFYR
jgi:hypothetical protein